MALWISVGMLVKHGLVLFLAVGMPLWDWYEIPRLKASPEPRKKIRYYGRIAAALWICTVIAVLTTNLTTVLAIHKAPGEVAWLESGSAGAAALKGVTAGIVIVVMLPAVLALWSEKIRAKAGRAAKKLAYLLPSSIEERRWWWLVAITAGVCEEIVYRGFLLHYWHALPWNLSLTWALVVSSIIFGVGHLYQGVAGAIQTTLIGLVFGGIFLATGSLLIPMVLHTLLDLRVLAMLPPGLETAE